MPADLTKPFDPSCCEGISNCNKNSALVCGCDPGAKWICERHRKEGVVAFQSVKVEMPVILPQFSTEIKSIQKFESGATRNDDSNKFDYEGFLNPEVLHAFGEYMHLHRKQRDGSIRDSDNWQKGIPFRKYLKSLVRHTIDLWRMDRGYAVTNPDTGAPHTKEELCCAIAFNVLGYLKELKDPSPINNNQ